MGTMEVEFSIQYKTKFGENLYIIGDSPLLGLWDTHKGRYDDVIMPSGDVLFLL